MDQAKILDTQQIILMGMSFYGDPFDTHSGWDEENHIGLLWMRFMRYLSTHPQVFRKNPVHATFEVHIQTDETIEKGVFEVFVGVQIDRKMLAEVPLELLVKVLPETQYAVVTLKGEEITSDWETVLEKKIKSMGFSWSGPYSMQYYDERFKGMDQIADSAVDVYVPVTKSVE